MSECKDCLYEENMIKLVRGTAKDWEGVLPYPCIYCQRLPLSQNRPDNYVMKQLINNKKAGEK